MSQNEWKQEPLRQVSTLIMGQSPDSKFYNSNGDGLPFLQGCAQFGEVSPETTVSCSLPAKVAPSGSILFSVRAPVGAINLADQRYCIGRGVAAISGKTVETQYLRYYLLSLSGDFERVSQGSTFSAINSTELGAFSVNYPESRTQQAKIAEVLATVDRALAQTDAKLAKQQRVKAGLMQELLTRGIDAGGNRRYPRTHTFKDSPLGPIPAEWDYTSLTELFTFPTGQVDPKQNPYSQWPLIAPDHIEQGTGRVLAVVSAEDQGAISGKYLFKPGDVVYSKIRPYLLKAFLAKFVGLCSADMYPLRPNKRVISDFLLLIILGESFSRFAIAASERSGFPKINRQEMADYRLAVPPIDEQQRIVATVNSVTDDNASLNKQRAKLQSLKAGLMQDLMTGRASVLPLLDQIE